jgi:hypothetical protein
MKRTLTGIFVLFAFFEGVVALAAFTPRYLGWSTISISSGTITEITNSTAPTVGYIRYCSNCAANGGQGTLCVSTGAANFNQFVLSTGTVCK